MHELYDGSNKGYLVSSIMTHEIGHIFGLQDGGGANANPIILGGREVPNDSLMNTGPMEYGGRNALEVFRPQDFDIQSLNMIYGRN